MSLPWFRLYRELKDDPKVGLLDDASFRVFIESLCWACEKADGSGGTGLTMENAGWAFRRNVTEPLLKLTGNGMLCLSPSGEIMVPKWEERQKRSDSSADRVRKFRGKQIVTLPETLHVTECNALEESRGDKKRREDKRPRPTLDDVRQCCIKNGLPDSDAVWFWNKCEGNGWTNGGKPIKSWTHTIASWKAGNYMPSQKTGQPQPQPAPGWVPDSFSQP